MRGSCTAFEENLETVNKACRFPALNFHDNVIHYHGENQSVNISRGAGNIVTGNTFNVHRADTILDSGTGSTVTPNTVNVT